MNVPTPSPFSPLPPLNTRLLGSPSHQQGTETKVSPFSRNRRILKSTLIKEKILIRKVICTLVYKM
jgi:hypothetical protein